ncbi:MAG: DUF6020 family protein, partial [Roseiflexus sp.]|nr:DUF6020 family protein [Roseiflexus sp.]
LRAFNGQQALNLTTFTHDGAWVWRDNGELVAVSGVTEPLRWRGWVRGALTLDLLAHPWSGKVRVQIGDQAQELDLYAETARSRTLTLMPSPPLWTRAQQGVLWLADIVSFGALLTGALLLTATWRPQARPFVLAWHWYALPCIVVWPFTLLVFWPGLMSLDSVDQWTQMLSGRYTDAHPAFHTLTMRVLTLLWLSPAAVALAQIGALALAFGLVLRELALLGVGKWVQIVLTALFALSPVNNLMVITLWRDIPYAIAMLFVFWSLLRVWRTDGAWLSSWRALAAIGAALAALALYRHNGAPTALLILPAFLLVRQQAHWRQVAIIGGVALALVLLVKVGVFRVLNVAPMTAPSLVARISMMHQIGAVVADPFSRIEDRDRALLENLFSLDEWRRRYTCYNVNAYAFAMPHPLLEQRLSEIEIESVWLRLAIAHPVSIVRHQLCQTSLIWRVKQPDDAYIFIFYPEIFPNDAGITSASVFPGIRSMYLSWVAAIFPLEWIWVWRPALYLYLALFCVAIACIRCRSWCVAGFAQPVVSQSLVWLLILPAQDFRYQYPVYVIALTAVCLIFITCDASRQR